MHEDSLLLCVSMVCILYAYNLLIDLVSVIYPRVFRADNLELDNYLEACPRRLILPLSTAIDCL